LKAIPAEHPTTDHGHASSHLLARSLVTYSNERYEDRILPFGTPDDALDCAAGLYLGNPPDRRPPKDERGAALGPFPLPVLAVFGVGITPGQVSELLAAMPAPPGESGPGSTPRPDADISG